MTKYRTPGVEFSSVWGSDQQGWYHLSEAEWWAGWNHKNVLYLESATSQQWIRLWHVVTCWYSLDKSQDNDSWQLDGSRFVVRARRMTYQNQIRSNLYNKRTEGWFSVEHTGKVECYWAKVFLRRGLVIRSWRPSDLLTENSEWLV